MRSFEEIVDLCHRCFGDEYWFPRSKVGHLMVIDDGLTRYWDEVSSINSGLGLLANLQNIRNLHAIEYALTQWLTSPGKVFTYDEQVSIIKSIIYLGEVLQQEFNGYKFTIKLNDTYLDIKSIRMRA